MGNEVVSIDAQFLVSAFGTAIVLIGILITIIAKVWLELIRKKIDWCYELLDSNIKNLAETAVEVKDSVKKAHNRITDHVEKHHTENNK